MTVHFVVVVGVIAVLLAVFGIWGARLLNRTSGIVRPKVQASVLGHPGVKLRQPTASAPEAIKIAGVCYRTVVKSTVEHDMWMMGKLRQAGLDELATRPNETATDYAVRLLHEVIASGEAMNLLGGLMVPDTLADLEWTPAIAASTADVLRKVSDPEEKAEIHGAIISMLTGFFAIGIGSYDRSGGASLAPSKAQASVQLIPEASA